jgi:hypothetical protein
MYFHLVCALGGFTDFQMSDRLLRQSSNIRYVLLHLMRDSKCKANSIFRMYPVEHQLVGDFNPSEIWKIWKSVGMIISNIWKVIKFHGSKPPTSQCLVNDVRSMSFRGDSLWRQNHLAWSRPGCILQPGLFYNVVLLSLYFSCIKEHAICVCMVFFMLVLCCSTIY